MSKILITGGSGFVGRHLAWAVAERGHELVCLVRKTSRAAPLVELGGQLVYGDVAKGEGLAEAVAGVDVVYHLAGLTRALSYGELLAVNGQGVHLIAQACAARPNPPVLVYVSSLAAAGPSPLDRPRTEGDPAAPVSKYGRSKLAGESAAAQWAGQVPTTIVRPAVVFGPYDRDCLEMFRPVARYGVHAVPGFRDSRLSLIHAADLARLLISAGERGRRVAPNGSGSYPAQGVYFAADAVQPTMAELGQMLAVAVGRPRAHILRTPRVGVWALGAACELAGRLRRRPLALHWDKAREALAGSWICSTERTAAELGFSPAAPLSARLAETAAWYRQQGWL